MTSLAYLRWHPGNFSQSSEALGSLTFVGGKSGKGTVLEDERLVHIIPFEVDASDHGFLSLKMGDGTVGVPFGVFILAQGVSWIKNPKLHLLSSSSESEKRHQNG